MQAIPRLLFCYRCCYDVTTRDCVAIPRYDSTTDVRSSHRCQSTFLTGDLRYVPSIRFGVDSVPARTLRLRYVCSLLPDFGLIVDSRCVTLLLFGVHHSFVDSTLFLTRLYTTFVWLFLPVTAYIRTSHISLASRFRTHPTAHIRLVFYPHSVTPLNALPVHTIPAHYLFAARCWPTAIAHYVRYVLRLFVPTVYTALHHGCVHVYVCSRVYNVLRSC